MQPKVGFWRRFDRVIGILLLGAMIAQGLYSGGLQ